MGGRRARRRSRLLHAAQVEARAPDRARRRRRAEAGRRRGGARGGGVEAAPAHDALLPWLSTEDELGLLVRERLEADGCRAARVLSRDECAAALEKMWSFVEGVSPAVRRDAPDTWYPSAEGAADPWPHSGWKSFSDMFQDNGAGWLFGDERELLAERVFSKLYGTRELHASKEGFTFHRPTAGGRHPLVGKTAYVCGQPTSADNGGAHFDQGHAGSGLQCIQSSTALLDQQEDDGCFLCWPGSHRHHGALTEGIWRGRSPWVPLTDAELDTLRAAGLAPRRVPVGAGDVILWRSDPRPRRRRPRPWRARRLPRRRLRVDAARRAHAARRVPPRR